jgi:hypothetical protein
MPVFSGVAPSIGECNPDGIRGEINSSFSIFYRIPASLLNHKVAQAKTAKSDHALYSDR